MADLSDRIAEVLREHEWRGDFLGCGCGWNWPKERTHFCGEDERIAKAHAAHVAEAVVAAIQPSIDRELTEAWQAGVQEGMRVDRG